MKKMLIMLLMAMFPSMEAHSYFVNIEFSLDGMIYYDYVTDSYISKPDYLSSDSASLSFDIDSYQYVDNQDDDYTEYLFNIDLKNPNYIQSPLVKYFSETGQDYYSDYVYNNFYGETPYGVADSYTADRESQYFEEYFMAHIGVGGISEDDGNYYSFGTRLSRALFTEMRNGDGTSDYALVGNSLLDYFEYLKINNIPFNITDYFSVQSITDDSYLGGIYSSGLAYITNISYENNVVPTPEPNTFLLISMGIIGLAAMARSSQNRN